DLNILALRKQADRTSFQQRICVSEQLLKRRKRTRRDDIERDPVGARKVLDSPVMHNGRKGEGCHAIAQEVGFLADTFDEVDFHAALVSERAGDNKAGKARPGAEVAPGPGGGGEIEELER